MKYNKRLAVSDGESGWKLRIFHRKSKGLGSPRFLVKCGCCDSKVEIYYDNDQLEINGVNASIREWRSILLPLLKR